VTDEHARRNSAHDPLWLLDVARLCHGPVPEAFAVNLLPNIGFWAEKRFGWLFCMFQGHVEFRRELGARMWVTCRRCPADWMEEWSELEGMWRKIRR
jgi:hypothetical protein